MQEMGKFLVIAGLILAGIGAILWTGVGKGWFGRLPGDLHYSRENVTFYFPVVTCLVLSVVISLLLWLFRK